MHKVFLLLVFIPLLGIAQNPAVNFQKQLKTVNPYVKLLGLAEEDALIIRSSKNSETDTICGSYLAVLSNGDMYQYGVYLPNFKPHVRKVKVTDAEKNKYIKYITDSNALDASLLNLTEVIMKDGSKSTIGFNDYPSYAIELFQGKNSAIYFSESADGFIEAQATGYQMRQKLVDIYKALNFSETIVANTIQSVKKQDTVYVHFKESAYAHKEKSGTDNYMYDIALSRNTHIYFVKKKDGITVSKINFFEKHKEQIVDYDFFLKYFYQVTFLNFKTIYVIEESKADNKTIIYPVTNFIML